VSTRTGLLLIDEMSGVGIDLINAVVHMTRPCLKSIDALLAIKILFTTMRR
jgi:hypothetical protein